MVKQGDILLVSLDPTRGHEQAGIRPILVISNDDFYRFTKTIIALPITTKKKNFPLHIPLDNRTKTQGYILCEQIKMLDVQTRGYKYLEHLPNDILKNIIDIVKALF